MFMICCSYNPIVNPSISLPNLSFIFFFKYYQYLPSLHEKPKYLCIDFWVFFNLKIGFWWFHVCFGVVGNLGRKKGLWSRLLWWFMGGDCCVYWGWLLLCWGIKVLFLRWKLEERNEAHSSPWICTGTSSLDRGEIVTPNHQRFCCL